MIQASQTTPKHWTTTKVRAGSDMNHSGESGDQITKRQIIFYWKNLNEATT